MPELPEVETIARALQRVLPGLRVNSAVLEEKTFYRRGSLPVSYLEGKLLRAIERVGKNVVFRLHPEGVMVVNLGMTGRLIFINRRKRWKPSENDHLHARFFLTGGKELAYYDVRKFGSFFIAMASEVERLLSIGPDPFQMSVQALEALLKNRSAPIKSVLLNQKIISGLGNIYVDETLFSSGIHPLCTADHASGRSRELLYAARRILRDAIAHQGSTVRDYMTPEGAQGAFQKFLAVYGREGKGCFRCGAVIEKIVVAGRGTHFCPRCQGKPRSRK